MSVASHDRETRAVDDAFWDDLVARAGDPAATSAERPSWVRTLQAVAALAAGCVAPDDSTRAGAAEEPSPFEALLRPFVAHGRMCVEDRLRRQTPAAATAPLQLGPGARADLERQLLGRLNGVSGGVFDVRLAAFRARRQTSLDRLLSRATGRGTGADLLVDEFIACEKRDGPVTVWRRFPVLARLQAQVLRDWVDATAELRVRLAADAELVLTLLGGDAPGHVVSVQTDLSDPHRHGRTVLILSFADGRRLVYKPKSLGMENGLAQLVDWLNGEGLPLRLRPVRVLDRTTHGWSEHIASARCAGEEEERRYTRRCGMLLALAHVLDITDLHLENLVGSGEHPVLIDLETMMTSRLPTPLTSEPLGGAAALIKEQLNTSVLRTSMLPQWHFDRADEPTDVSALAPSPPGSAKSVGDARAVSPVADYLDELLQGFVETYQLLRKRQTALAGAGGQVHELGAHEARFLARDTRVYAGVIRESLSPECLADAGRRRSTVQRLAAAVDRNPENGAIAAIVGAEIEAVHRLDVPIFTTRPDSGDLVLDEGGVLERAFAESGIERALSRIQGLNEADLERQVGHIRAAFIARGNHDSPSLTRTAGVGPVGGPPTDVELIRVARDIAQNLERRAIRGDDGSIGWITLQRDPESGRRRIAPTGDDLYGGTAGIALFLAAFARMTGTAAYAEMATAILRGAVLRTRSSDADSPRRGLGLAQGAGSLVQALVSTAGLLEDPSLLADARHIAMAMAIERVEADDALDLLGGAAGALLALMNLYEATGDQEILVGAKRCAAHLLARRRSHEDGLRAWPTADGALTTGFPHGASGIAHALLRLESVNGQACGREAALEGLRWERCTFSQTDGNWTSRLNVPAGTPVMTRWCQGAPGIALGRVSAITQTDDAALEEDLEIALRTTASYPWTRLDLDGVCCGNAGRVDVLLTAAQALDRPGLEARAKSMTGEMLAGAADEGGFRCFAGAAAGFFEPSLFSGVAGIGYVLLRCVDPVALPPLVTFAGGERRNA